MAQTLYHIFDDSVYQGKNDASGDTIIMSFHNNELEKLNIIAGAQGYIQPRLNFSRYEIPCKIFS